jgi:DNA mismatch repair protein MutS
MAIVPGRGNEFGVALVDVSTGEFTTTEYEGAAGLQALADEIAVLRPREVLVPAGSDIVSRLGEIRPCATARDDGRGLDV